MENLISKISSSLRECYNQSVLIDSKNLQNLLFDTLIDFKKLEDMIADMETTKEELSGQLSKRYTYDEVLKLLKIRLELAKDEISLEVAHRETLKINPNYPVHNLLQDSKRLQKTLNGVGEYGFAYPANWAKALFELTNNDPLVIEALKEQQRLYLEKDGRNNKKLEKLLNDIENR